MSTSTQYRLRRVRREGACFATMLGAGELFIPVLGVSLGGSPITVALLIAVPLALGGMASMASLSFHRRGLSPKRIAIYASLAQGAGYLLLGAATWLSLLDLSSLILAAVILQLFGQTAAVSWSTWIGELVPEQERARFFASRNRVVHATSFLTALVAGAVLHFGQSADCPTGRLFAGLFVFAGCARALSSKLLCGFGEPASVQDEAHDSFRRILAKNREARRILLVLLFFMTGVWVAAPYFASHMLATLRLGYLEYSVAGISVVVGTVATLPWWGAVITRAGSRRSYLWAVFGIATLPIPWFWADTLWWIVPAQIASGIAWAGHELALFTSVLGSAATNQRAQLFALVSLTMGAAQLLGTFIGAVLIRDGGFFRVLEVSTLARMAAFFIALGVVPRVQGIRTLALRVVGVRFAGGLRLRPVTVLPSTDETTDERKE